MRVTVLTSGSRGDIQPYAALAHGLQSAGHQVIFAASRNGEQFARDLGLSFFPIAGNPSVDVFWEDYSRGFERVEAGRVLLRNLARQLTGSSGVYQERFCRHTRDVLEACSGSDAIVFALPLSLAGEAAAEKLQVTFLPAYVDPVVPTRAFPNPFLSRLRLGARSNYLLSAAFRRIYWRLHLRAANVMRQVVLRLPAFPSGQGPGDILSRPGQPMVFGYSAAVLPKPEDWGPDLHVTGYWNIPLRPEWKPDASLCSFLDDGDKPIYAGFGSVHVTPSEWQERRTPRRLIQMVVDAVVKARQRAVLLMEPSLRAELRLPDCIFPTANIPFEWLFPRVAAAIHHGGAGTTGAALTGGIPSVVIPFYDVHPFWAHRIYELGAGPRPMHFHKVTADNLAGAIKAAVTNPDMRARAAELGARLRLEDGVGAVVRLLEARVRGLSC
jgi:sterol 3beta-glucosyltransferase